MSVIILKTDIEQGIQQDCSLIRTPERGSRLRNLLVRRENRERKKYIGQE